MKTPNDYSFVRYLKSKQSIDDRALNQQVWLAFLHTLNNFKSPNTPVKILELGGGIGTMITRLLKNTLTGKKLPKIEYTMVDQDPELILISSTYLKEWCQQHGFDFLPQSDGYVITQKLIGDSSRQAKSKENIQENSFSVKVIQEKVEPYLADNQQRWDFVLAHALLDLLNLYQVIPLIFSGLSPDGFFYFTLNYNGGTRFWPISHPLLEERVLTAYDESMGVSKKNRGNYPHSKTGFYLSQVITEHRGQMLKYGSSDWKVEPHLSHLGKYPPEEDYFLYYILNFFASLKPHLSPNSPNSSIPLTVSLTNGNQTLTAEELERWLLERRKLVEMGKLSFACQQLDFLGRVN